jgi:N-acyl homoserine lactone hydrolase
MTPSMAQSRLPGRFSMIHRSMLALMGLTFALSSGAALAQTKADLGIIRLDCGAIRFQNAAGLSDTHGYDGKKLEIPVSCYLIRHGSDYLLWDAGLGLAYLGTPLNDKDPVSSTVTRSLIDQVKALGIDPKRITKVAVSHYHLDHAGQAASFPDATLLIGAADWTAMASGTVPALADANGLAPWLKQGKKVQPVERDLDVFGDGSVVMFDTQGHTHGHHSLLVRLPKMGPVLLTGDLYHTRRNFDLGDVPDFNASRANTLASMDRFKATARSLRATVIIGHEAADIAKLPAFPKEAN